MGLGHPRDQTRRPSRDLKLPDDARLWANNQGELYSIISSNLLLMGVVVFIMLHMRVFLRNGKNKPMDSTGLADALAAGGADARALRQPSDVRLPQ
jgi:hypothetical protein